MKDKRASEGIPITEHVGYVAGYEVGRNSGGVSYHYKELMRLKHPKEYAAGLRVGRASTASMCLDD